jgi:probable HAF family extracellular repeat protein
MRDLGTLGGDHSFAVSVNERGQVTGWASTRSGHPRAMRWDPATGMRDLGTLGGDSSTGWAVNDRGQVAGTSDTASGSRRAFLWDPATGMRDLGTLGGDGSWAEALNERGQVAGTATTESGAEHAFLWDPGTGMRDLGSLGSHGRVVGLNERGQAAGTRTLPSGEQRAFLWDEVSGMRDLGTLGGDSSVARAVNEGGQVVGSARSDADSGSWKPFRWDPSTGMRDLGQFGGPGTQAGVSARAQVWEPDADWQAATALNDSGQVAGNSDGHAFTWDSATGMRDLGSLGPWPAEGGVTALNERGQAAGSADLTSTESLTAVVWTPSSLAPRVSVAATRTGYGDRLFVNVTPNRYRASENWTFRVQKRSASGTWTTLPGTHRTQGTAETRTLALGAGVFRVMVAPRFGHQGAITDEVRLTPPTVEVGVRAVDDESRLFVNVAPNRGAGYWTFRIQKRTPTGSWTTLATTYTTLGVKEARTINLRAGTYRVRVNPKYGYLGTTSATVRIVR